MIQHHQNIGYEGLEFVDVGEVTLPEGLVIQKNQRGKSMHAGRDFKKGQAITTDFKCLRVPVSVVKLRMMINGEEFLCQRIHMTLYDTYRQFALYNSFVNHQCEPNSVFTENKITGIEDWTALRDIKKGEEITCNYLNFSYFQEQEFQCFCKSPNCFKVIKGFKFLNLDEKIKLIPILYEQTKNLWLKDDQRIVLMQDLPKFQNLKLKFINQNNFSVESEIAHKKGETILIYTPIKIKKNSIVIFKDGSSYKKIDFSSLCSQQKQQKQFQFLQTLIKHSAAPNLKLVQDKDKDKDKDQKVGVCIRDINAGDQVTIEIQQNYQDQIYDFGFVQVADGVVISENQFGKCLLAGKDFKKGEIVLQDKLKYVPLHVNKYKFTTKQNEYFCETTHSVKQGQQRIIFDYSGFMNHSCNYNTVQFYQQQSSRIYQRANRDIKKGQQLTCNYLHFDYDCDGHQFQCQCGSPKCYGYINGFRFLDLEKKMKLLPFTSWQVKQMFCRDDNVIIVQDLKVPQNLQIIPKQQHKFNKLISKISFKKGEIILKLIPLPLPDENTTVIYKVGEVYQKFDPSRTRLTSTSPSPLQQKSQKHRRQFCYFRQFTTESADPNCQVVRQGEFIVGLCVKNIQENQEVKQKIRNKCAANEQEQIQ